MNNFGQKSVSEILEFSKNGPKIKKILDDLFGAYENNESALARVQGKDPVNPQDFVTKAFLQATTQTLIQYAYATNTNITTNLNANAGNFVTDVPLFGNTVTSNGNTDFEFISSTQLKVKFSGLVLILTNVHITSNTQRTSVNIRSKRNSTPVNGVGATGYIRATNHHNESSLHISGPVVVSSNDILSIGCRQEANSGAVYMNEIGTSNIVVMRLR